MTRKRVNKKRFVSGFDALGSYTGVDASNPYERPTQDADDL